MTISGNEDWVQVAGLDERADDRGRFTQAPGAHDEVSGCLISWPPS